MRFIIWLTLKLGVGVGQSANVIARCIGMVTSSNGNIFRVTSHLCGEFPGEFSTQRPVTRSFDVFFDLRLNKRLSIQSWVWWFETPSRPLWCHLMGRYQHDSLRCSPRGWEDLRRDDRSESVSVNEPLNCNCVWFNWHPKLFVYVYSM